MNDKNKRLLKRVGALCLTSSMIGFALGMVVGKVSVNVSAESDNTPEETLTKEPVVATYLVAEPTPTAISIQRCKLSAYCKENYPHICNDGNSKVTATNTVPTVGRTVAVDPNVIPYGSEVIINGHTYIAEDCGGAIKGNRIDILFETHQEALNFGIQYADVCYVIKEI